MSRILLESACNLAPRRGEGDDYEGTLEKVTVKNGSDYYQVTVTRNEDIIASYSGSGCASLEQAVQRWIEWKAEYNLA